LCTPQHSDNYQYWLGWILSSNDLFGFWVLWCRATIICMEGQLPSTLCMELGMVEWWMVRLQPFTPISNLEKGVLEEPPATATLLGRAMVSSTHTTCFSIHPLIQVLEDIHNIMVHLCLLPQLQPCHQVCPLYYGFFLYIWPLMFRPNVGLENLIFIDIYV